MSPGLYHDLPQTKLGAVDAECRAIAAVLSGKPIALPKTKEVEPAKVEPEKKVLTIREHSKTFLKFYKPEAETEREARQEGLAEDPPAALRQPHP